MSGEDFLSRLSRQSRRLRGRSPSPLFLASGERLILNEVDNDAVVDDVISLGDSDDNNVQDIVDILNDTFVTGNESGPSVSPDISDISGENQGLLNVVSDTEEKLLVENNLNINDNSESEISDVINMAQYKVPNSVIDPGTFSGLSNENVCNYISQFETVAAASAWDDEKKNLFLPCFLRGSAKMWYDDYIKHVVAADKTWENLRAALFSHFNSKSFKELALAKLSMRLQGDTEPFETYYYDVLNFCNVIDMAMAEDA